MDGRVALEEYLLKRQLDGIADSTIEQYEISANRLFDHLSADVGDITLTALQKYLLGYTNVITRATQIKNLRTFFKYLVENGHLSENPFDGIDNPRLPKRFPKVLTEAEMKKLIIGVSGSHKNLSIVLLMCDSGIRASELGSIKKSDVNYDEGNILIEKGKGDKSRMVYISQITARALKSYLSRRRDNQEWLFLTERGNPYNRDSLRLLIYRLSEKHIGRKISPHVLRHTFATLYVKNGGDSHSLKELLGHADTRMAEIYVNFVGKDIQEIHQRCSPVRLVTG